MTKADFLQAIKTELGGTCRKEIDKVLNAAGRVALKALAAGGDIPLLGIGALKVVQRAARPGRNPKTGEAITIPARRAAKFMPGKALKDVLN